MAAMPSMDQMGTLSTFSAVSSTVSWAGLPTTGTIETAAPPTRMGTVTSFVNTQPLENERIIKHIKILTYLFIIGRQKKPRPFIGYS